MNENSKCNLCELAETANPQSICLKGRGETDAPLLILLDAPGMVEDRRRRSFVSEGAEFLDFLMSKMSIPRSAYYLDYILKCYPKPCKAFGRKAPRQAMIEACSTYLIATLQLLKPKAIVLMGTTACEMAMGNEKVGQFEGASWTSRDPIFREFVPSVWITYSPAYGIQDPAEAVGIYRTLYHAAITAGLHPKWDSKPSFNYGT